MIVYSVIFCAILVCCVNPWPSLLCNNLLGYCTCTAIILAYKIMCSQKLYVSGASMLQVENKYGVLTILCLEHSIPLHKLW